MINVFFQTNVPAEVLKARPALKKAALLGLGRVNAHRKVNLIFVGAGGIKSLNRRFLGKNRLTDVIAFNFPPAHTPGADWGEIYICVPAATRQSRNMGHSLIAELLVLALHGALHLSGMDDYTPKLRRRMNIKTAALLKRI